MILDSQYHHTLTLIHALRPRPSTETYYYLRGGRLLQIFICRVKCVCQFQSPYLYLVETSELQFTERPAGLSTGRFSIIALVGGTIKSRDKNSQFSDYNTRTCIVRL